MRAGGLNDSLSFLGDPGSPVDPPFRGDKFYPPPPRSPASALGASQVLVAEVNVGFEKMRMSP